jgi:hypothetical protein
VRASSGRNGLICRLPGRGGCLGRGPSTKWQVGWSGEAAGHTAARSGAGGARVPRWFVSSGPLCGARAFWLGDFPAVRQYHTLGMCSGVTPHQGPCTRSIRDTGQSGGSYSTPERLKDLLFSCHSKAILARGCRSEICFSRFAAGRSFCARYGAYTYTVLQSRGPEWVLKPIGHHFDVVTSSAVA